MDDANDTQTADRIVELPDRPLRPPAGDRSERTTLATPAPPANPRGAWLLPLVALSAIVSGALFVMRGPDRAFGVAFGALLAVGLGWIVVSVFFPARADRACPACGETALARLSRDSTTGLRCRRCDWVDESASGFLLAEEEGPLEPIVLGERAKAEETSSTS